MAHFIASRAASVAPAARVVTALRAFVDGVAHEVRLMRDLRRIEGLDDHLLHDIGLDRGGLEDAVRFGRRPRR